MDGQLIHCGKGPEGQRLRRRGNKSSQGLQAYEPDQKRGNIPGESSEEDKPVGQNGTDCSNPASAIFPTERMIEPEQVAVPEVPEMEGNRMADMPENAEGGNERNG
ncbi:hypothetical protein DFH07DRAFT_782419 [Mycena maculata]|uniref:Uncharacterized protein n=1 Tax=Mycena maculata TaxID=230809 RepID=A0AAD7HTA7_9AGAR|nr:hypothetical protein DFH07DRAFT_782419 [Mycena maculata]